MDHVLYSAISAKNLIRFYYDGGFRIVEPFCYGRGKSGNDLLRGYQVDGHSNSGHPAWKLFNVSKISNLSVTDKGFNNIRPHYNPQDSAMKYIYCCV
ncbi:hypothetical protein C4588_05560 [Candidatus Parcubacteria bacterium]|nr:MAG: hypothetical protein C4588_05560 [Candidatus Parcubacteria bacterium]